MDFLKNKWLLWGGGGLLAIGAVIVIGGRAGAAPADDANANSGGIYYPPTVVGSGGGMSDIAPGGLNSSTSYSSDATTSALIEGNLKIAQMQFDMTKYKADTDKEVALGGYTSALAMIKANADAAMGVIGAQARAALGLANANNSAALQLSTQNNTTSVQNNILSYLASIGATDGTVQIGGDPSRSGTVNISGTLYDNSPKFSSEVKQLYQTAVGRAPDADGAKYWQAIIDKGVPMADVYAAFNRDVIKLGYTPNAASVAQYGTNELGSVAIR